MSDSRAAIIGTGVLSAHACEGLRVRTDRMFAGLMIVQWAAWIVAALAIPAFAPVRTAFLAGWAIAGIPVALGLLRPGWWVTRHAFAVAQMLAASLFIELCGGRMESQFHIFGSLAFLACYRDWRVLVTATVVLAVAPSHTFAQLGWVLFCDAALILSIRQGLRDMDGAKAQQQRLADSYRHLEAVKQELLATNIVLNAEAEQRKKRESELIQAAEDLEKETAARRRAEQQFIQSQKLEAIGRLAGGVAHDFNNILTVILGTSEMLLSPEHHLNGSREMVEQISKAANRAAGLTRQLLTFSRQDIVTQVPLNLNAVVTDAEKMFRRVIKENIQLRLKLAPALRPVKADPGQLEQILMNLVVNASDAMPDGGRIHIETGSAEPDAILRNPNPVKPEGPFVRLSVTDTGCGMDERTMARICEPFFTTKAKGKGTGLGLATVYGIIQEAGGWLDVESQPGCGSTFNVYLPECPLGEMPAAAAPEPERAPSRKGRKETVLLVEDEESLRKLLQRVMTEKGYTVLAASDGQEAIRLCEEHAGPIHILVTDLVMPGLNGRQVSERVGAMREGIPVLFMSGYTDDEQVRHCIRESCHQFIQKPFTPAALTHKLREVMGASPEPAGAPVRFSF